jgi:hypothetical protein
MDPFTSRQYDEAIPAGLDEIARRHQRQSRTNVTEGGVWTYRNIDVHRCNKPTGTQGVKAGDRWKCNGCGTEWVVAHVGYDQRDNSSWLTWNKYTRDDTSGMYAPGTK